MAFLSFFIGILIFLFLITLHEFGHFVMSKIFKVYVYEFAIGIGPKIISWSGKETMYSIRLFPFGGYVYVASEQLDPPKGKEDITIDEKRYIENINRAKRIAIILSGIFMNFFIAILIFTSVFTITNCSPNDINGYGANYYTNSDSPSFVLGLNNDDLKNPYVITEISFVNYDTNNNVVQTSSIPIQQINKNAKILSSDNKISNFYDTATKLQNILSVKSNYNTIFIKYEKYQYKTHTLIPTNYTNQWFSQGYHYNSNTIYKSDDHYIIGMKAPNLYFSNRFNAYLYGWKKMFEDSISILKAFGHLFTGNWSQVVGPIGTLKETQNFINSGFENFILYVGLISANLFVLNLIPIAPLDGFKFTIISFESIIRKEINQRLKLFITIIGAVMFLILFILLTLKDIF